MEDDDDYLSFPEDGSVDNDDDISLGSGAANPVLIIQSNSNGGNRIGNPRVAGKPLNESQNNTDIAKLRARANKGGKKQVDHNIGAGSRSGDRLRNKGGIGGMPENGGRHDPGITHNKVQNKTDIAAIRERANKGGRKQVDHTIGASSRSGDRPGSQGGVGGMSSVASSVIDIKKLKGIYNKKPTASKTVQFPVQPSTSIFPSSAGKGIDDGLEGQTAEEIYGPGESYGGGGGSPWNSKRPGRMHQYHSSTNLSGLSNHSDAGKSFVGKEALLENLEENNQSMAAAADFVRGSSNPDTNIQRRFIRKLDYVLVSTVVLDGARGSEAGDDPLGPTIESVNKYGFPKGRGKKDIHKKGPYVYVLCEVLSAHFDGNVPYYKVKRFDTGAEQKADRGDLEWIEKGTEGQKAAMDAAKQKPDTKSGAVDPLSTNCLNNKCFHVVGRYCWKGLLAVTGCFKDQASKCLSGKAPYTIELKFTTVNFLVLCAVIVAFLEHFKHFLRVADYDIRVADYDKWISWIIFAAWTVLVLELFFELCLRPKNYSELLKGESAYSPSTARSIDRFHLFCESIALASVVVEFLPIFLKGDHGGELAHTIGFTTMAANATDGETGMWFTVGHLYFILVRLRLFNLVRHVRNHWIKSYESEKNSTSNEGELASLLGNETQTHADNSNSKEDATLRKAGTIGTALLLVNSHRAMVILLLIGSFVPFFASQSSGGRNLTNAHTTAYLHRINVHINETEPISCDFANRTVEAWLDAENHFSTHITEGHIWHSLNNSTSHRVVQVMMHKTDQVDSDLRCKGSAWNVTRFSCTNNAQDCENMTATGSIININHLVNIEKDLNIRHGSLVGRFEESKDGAIRTEVIYNLSASINRTAFNSFMLQLSMLGLAILAIGRLRTDANRLVITPLRRMLKIVLRYAENPLDGLEDVEIHQDSELGAYETDQLIAAVTKITDLLRKCWGVAGAGIISSNLARNITGKNTVVFNPTVPGKIVHALFGFAGLSDFSHLLRILDNQVMDLINDVAQVIHNEVFRWAFADKGQCNKNLGACFLMVYRIGDFEEVREKMTKATEFVFQENQRISKKDDIFDEGKKPIHLASLPGIAVFADRALLGLLKTFAGINRERCIKKWEEDFGYAGIKVQMSFGMDAAWAVEGAVGSSYKIDATYLSPHVNMASRMMCACRQFKLTILMSQAVQELLSREARECVRHVDTVFVKGSIMKQRIYTYDARHEGVDFFLNKRSDELADQEADKYTPAIWKTDQDLIEMRSHITPNFRSTFQRGLDQYLLGNFKEAAVTLEEADWIMIETVVADGRQENVNAIGDQLLNRNINQREVTHHRKRLGDGPSQALIEFIKENDYKAPALPENPPWDGVRQLEKK